jgi:hypothetical protein
MRTFALANEIIGEGPALTSVDQGETLAIELSGLAARNLC